MILMYFCVFYLCEGMSKWKEAEKWGTLLQIVLAFRAATNMSHLCLIASNIFSMVEIIKL